MAHLAFYRKWRPKTFDGVYGQDYVVQTLKNEIAAGKPSHAYLFTGSRGTGKTSIAKILAKAVNCQNPQNGNPCLSCESCQTIENETTLDVVEMDAASNNGVDYIRQLREEANYPPTVCKYRVYIIDEVHMLSNSAFNALLKIMEEPPAHVIFVLATTEVEQVPATILSRCQRFDFRRIPDEAIIQCLADICQKEGIAATKEALATIARLSDGGMRDAVSLLDQCAGAAQTIDNTLVQQVAFAAGREPIYKLTQCIAQKTPVPALQEVAALHKDAKNMTRLTAELIGFFRLMMLAQVDAKLADSPLEEENATAVQLAALFTQQQVLGTLAKLEDCYARQKHTVDPKTELEIALISLCDKRQQTEPDALLGRLEKLEQLAAKGNLVGNPMAQSPTPAMPEAKASPAKAEQPAEQPSVPTNDPIDELPPWEEAPLPQEPPADAYFDPAEEAPLCTDAPSPVPPKTASVPAASTVTLDWPEVMEQLESLDAPLAGMLQQPGVRAALSGGALTVDVGDFRLAGVLLQQQSHADCLQKAVALAMQIPPPQILLGDLGQTTASAPQDDPFEDYLKKAQNQGIKIEME